MRRSLIIGLLIIPCVLQIIGAGGFGWISDDAFISFRFTENFLNGHGLTWNIGEKPVEGYTNFLYVMLLCLHRPLGLDLPAWSITFNLLCSLASLVLATLLTRRLVGRLSLLCLVPPLLLSLNPSFNYWAVGGLETHLLTMLLLAAALIAVQLCDDDRPARCALFSLVLALAALTRPEALGLAAVLFAVFAARILIRHGRRTRAAWSRLAALVLPLNALIGAHTLWRLAYYGYLFPNTFYCKTGGGWTQVRRGVQYVWAYGSAADTDGLILLVVLLLTRSFWARRGWIPAGFLGILLGMTIGLGGDCLIQYRFLVPLFPFAYVLVALGLAGIAEQLKTTPRLAWFALAVFSFASCLIGVRLARSNPMRYKPAAIQSLSAAIVHSHWPLAVTDGDAMCEVALYLKRNLPPEAIVAANGIGRLGYYSGLPVLDRLGLCDEHIAHRKMDFLPVFAPGHDKRDEAYVLQRRPALILPGCFAIQPQPLTFSTPREIEIRWRPLGMMPGDHEIFQMADFWESYHPQIIDLGNGSFLHVFRRNDA